MSQTEVNTDLTSLLSRAADKAVKDGMTLDLLDDHPGGNVHLWCKQNIRYRPETEFFVVFLVCGAIADRLAQSEGYESNVDRAAKLARLASE